VIRVGAALLLFAACADDSGPRLASADPRLVRQGGFVTLAGERLCGEAADCAAAGGAVRIGYDNPVQAQIVDYADTSAIVRIPDIVPIGETVMIVTVNERASNALSIEVIGAL
jgi:hypothetical protein